MDVIMKLFKKTLLASSIISTIILAGCATNNAPVVEADGPNGPRDNFDNKTFSQAESEINDASSYSAEEIDQLANTLLKVKNVIYFGFDSYELTSESTGNAQKISELLIKYPKEKLRITGHADPRGSEQYNFNLGQKRAIVLQDYLINSGVQKDQVCTVSYGELQLASSPEDHDGNADKAYQMDRRDILDFGKDCSGE